MNRAFSALLVAAQLLAAAPAWAAQRTSGPGPGGPTALPAPAGGARAAAAGVPALVELSGLLNTPLLSEVPPAAPPSAAEPASRGRGVSLEDLKLAALLNRVPLVPEALGRPAGAAPSRVEEGAAAPAADAPPGPASVKAAIAGTYRALEGLSLSEIETMPLEDLDGVARRVMDEVLRARSIAGSGEAPDPALPSPSDGEAWTVPSADPSPETAEPPPPREGRLLRVAKRLPWMTAALMAANTVVYAGEVASVEHGLFPSGLDLLQTWGLWPIAVQDALHAFDLPALAHRAATLASSMLMHASAQHLLSNLGPLLLYGLFVERGLGPWKLLKLYLGAGLLGGLAFLGLHWGGTDALVGASGAVAAVLGAFVAGGFARGQGSGASEGLPLRILKALLLVKAVFWLVGEVMAARLELAGVLSDGVAHDVHVAGFALGAAAALWWRRRAARPGPTGTGGGPGPSEGSEGTRP